MAGPSWLLLLCLAGGVLHAGGQRAPDTTGFVSVDCGLSEHSGYVDDATKLPYSSDAGQNYNVSAQYNDQAFLRRHRQLLTVRYRPPPSLLDLRPSTTSAFIPRAAGSPRRSSNTASSASIRSNRSSTTAILVLPPRHHRTGPAPRPSSSRSSTEAITAPSFCLTKMSSPVDSFSAPGVESSAVHGTQHDKSSTPQGTDGIEAETTQGG
ncbi:uncharacterized protein [Triticum aestivum]|uniref:uncharacterized protein n=1 Tax=Triticum aestivum TaxID=4565 RepID=UPI001D02FC86|nr:uncharacterized protein LOC123101347 [Triticum aestivum]